MNGYHILGATASSETGDAGVPASSTTDAEARNYALAYLNSLVGTPYIWASKNPSNGLDCSGAYVVALEHAGLARPGARYKYGSADLHKALQPTSNPKMGDAVFYGKNGKVSHIMMIVGDGRVLGATGGGRNTKTIDDAHAANAAVKYKPLNYRPDFISYGSAPSINAPLAGSASNKLDTSDSRAERNEKIGYGISVVIFAAIGAWWARWVRSRSLTT